MKHIAARYCFIILYGTGYRYLLLGDNFTCSQIAGKKTFCIFHLQKGSLLLFQLVRSARVQLQADHQVRLPPPRQAGLCRLLRDRGVRLLLLPRDCRGVHELREERLLPDCAGLQAGHRGQEHPAPELGHLPQGQAQLFDSRGVSLLLQRDPECLQDPGR